MGNDKPYSPDLNPIEEVWSKVKGVLKQFRPRTKEEIWGNLPTAIASVTTDNLKGWFNHSYPSLIH